MANQELFVLPLNAVVTGFAYFYITQSSVVPTATKSQSMIFLSAAYRCSLKALFFGAAALHSILFFSPHIGSSVRLDTSLPWPLTSLLKRH